MTEVKKKPVAKNKSKRTYETPLMKRVKLTSSYRMASTWDNVSGGPYSPGPG